MGIRIVVLATGLLGSSFAAHADDVMRCAGGALVRLGMSAEEVVAKCGEPKSKEIEDVPIQVRNKNGAVNAIGTTTMETWTYDRGSGQFPALLKFDAGKLKTIELLTR